MHNATLWSRNILAQAAIGRGTRHEGRFMEDTWDEAFTQFT